jgi:hypothetical protein
MAFRTSLRFNRGDKFVAIGVVSGSESPAALFISAAVIGCGVCACAAAAEASASAHGMNASAATRQRIRETASRFSNRVANMGTWRLVDFEHLARISSHFFLSLRLKFHALGHARNH